MYSGTLICDLLSTVERAERSALEEAAKIRNQMSGYELFPISLPAWHPAKPSVEEIIRFHSEGDEQ